MVTSMNSDDSMPANGLLHHPGMDTMSRNAAQLRTLLNALPDLVWLKDPNGVFLGCNHRFESYFGAKESDIVGKTDHDFVDRELADTYLDNDRRAMASGKSVINEELITFAVDGHQELLETIKTPTLGSGGEILGVLGIGRDITLRKKAEESLRESEAQFRRYIELSPIGILECDQKGRCLTVNPAACRITGYSPGDLLGSSIPELLQPESREFVPGLLQQLLETGHCFGELAYKLRCGRPACCAVQGVRLSPARFLCFATDITERKATEEQQRLLEAQLQQARKMESLGILVAGVAHNFNHLLTLIMGAASVRERRTAEPKDLETYRTIGRVCLQGREMVKSLMQFAQPALASRAPIDLHAAMGEVVALLENTISKRIKILETFAGEPLWINGNAGNINHALVNLCINAVDAMPQGGTLALRTAIPEAGWAEVSVSDTGTGMAPEVLAHVLEPFFTTKAVGKGTGLGLSTTYGAIKAHGGTMDISSQPGLGTTVRLRFPRIPAPVQRQTVTPPSPAPSLESMKVLLVDDEESVRCLMALMLKEVGVHQVKTFSEGRKAIESLRKGELPDLVILDQNMPGMDGLQAMAEIRQLHPDLPILIASGQPDIEQWDCFRQSKVGVITKPFSLEEIQAKLARFAGDSAPGHAPCADLLVV
jgi:PAS domain S-box-containing protein